MHDVDTLAPHGSGHARLSTDVDASNASNRTLPPPILERIISAPQPTADILVIEDDAGVAETLCRDLRDAGCVVDVAGTAAEGQARLGRHRYGVLLLDLMMPDTDGMEMLKALHRNPALRPTTIIVLAAHSEVPRVLDALNAGADDYITTPYDPTDLYLRVTMWLHSARSVPPVVIGKGAPPDLIRRPNMEASARRRAQPLLRSTASAHTLSIQMLGGFQVATGSRVIAESSWRMSKAKALLALLALSPDHQLHREQVMDLLWPNLEPEAAASNYHKALHVVRRTLEPDLEGAHGYLHVRNAVVYIEPPGSLRIDVQMFEAAAHAAQAAHDPALYESALSLYTGDLLPADRFQEWASARREELKGTQIALLMRLAALREQRDEIEGAIGALRQVVSSDPAHEQAHVSLMRLLAKTGSRHLALRQYEHLREALRRELDVEPDPAVHMLYQHIRSGQY